MFAYLWRLITTPYEPDEAFTGFLDRALSRENERANVTVAVLSSAEARRVFGVDLARRGIQPVFLEITNRSPASLRLQFVTIDPRYFTPLEAAGATHFSIMRRLSAFGAMAWLFVPLFALVPLKLVTAWLSNERERFHRPSDDQPGCGERDYECKRRRAFICEFTHGRHRRHACDDDHRWRKECAAHQCPVDD